MKSFYKLILIAALLYSPVPFSQLNATTIFKEKRPSEYSEEIFTYDLSVTTALGVLEIEIHAREQNEPFVKRVAQILKEDSPQLIEYFGYIPWNKVHFVVDGFVDDLISKTANGGATVSPRPYIILYTAPPLGMEHLVTRGDWVKTLVLHELIHILHIDQTAGFMKIFRYLFGSDGKYGGIVPGWFAEGIATWGETKFTNGGRLSSDLYHFDYYNRILNNSFCATSDCLDNAGKPPYQGVRYLFGSHFMEWIESKKSGSIACLVKSNSDNVPFFLHWAFRDCVGEDFQILYQKYHTGIKNELISRQKRYREKPGFENFDFFEIEDNEFLLFEDGFEVLNGKAFIIERDEKFNNKLKVLDLKTKKKESQMLSDELERLLATSSFDRTRDQINFKTRREYASYNDTLWKSYSPKKKDFSGQIEWSEAKYIFNLKDREIGILYNKNTWEVWEKRGDKKEMIFDLPVLGNLFNPEVVEDGSEAFITYRYHEHRATPAHEYLRVDLNSRKEEVLFQNNDALAVLGSCGNRRVVATKTDRYLINIQNGYVSNLRDNFKKLVHLKGDKNHIVILVKDDAKRIYFKKGDCEKWLDEQSGIELVREMSSEASPDKNYLEDKSSYPEWDHYIPQRWSIGFSGGDATSGWTFSTSVSDPASVHNVDGQYKLYSDNDEKGGQVTYLHSNSYFNFFGSYFKEYLTSNTKTSPDYVEQSSAGILKTYYKNWLRYTPSLSYARGTTSDIVSSRKFKKYAASLTLETEGIHYSDFFSGAEFNLGVSRTEVVRGKTYLGYRGKPRLFLRFNYDFTLSLQGTYEKLDKTDLFSGVSYAGGVNDSLTGAYHEFYGIQSNDAFGNEIYSGKAEGRFLIRESYRGPLYFPLFIKRLHLLGGAGFLKTDFIFIDSDRKFLRDKSIANVFGGISSDLDLGYLASLRVDFIMAQILSNEITNKQSQLLLLVNAGF